MAERTISGVTADTFNYLQLGAGAIIRDFEYREIKTPQAFKAALLEALATEQNLGGTRGGVALSILPTTRKPVIDGVAADGIGYIGGEVIDYWTAHMATSLVQFSPQTLQEAFPTAVFTNVNEDEGSGITSMRLKQQFDKADYAENHTLISTTKYGYLMVAMFNTLARLTGDIQTTDNNEAVIPIDILPNYGNFEEIDYVPAEIWIIDMGKNTIEPVTLKA